ncbi:hypothetical protein [Lentilactobacillus otakiensis]|uniref:hypothetical protein n=1 Tax=Lentilactobacillus otakiensis TaxID=481720 RepID=UPI003D18118A
MSSVNSMHPSIKKYWLLLLGAFIIVSLTACMPKMSSKEDSLTVYNNENTRILYTTNKAKVTKLSQLISKSDTNAAKIVMPKNSKLKYRYVLHQKVHDVNINVYVYKNTHNIKMTNIPVLKTIYYRLSPSDYRKMSQPKTYLN